jgi:Zinc knuckle
MYNLYIAPGDCTIDIRNIIGNMGTVNDGVSFAHINDDGIIMIQKGNEGNQKTNNDKSKITCFRCDKKGHYSNECPEKGEPLESGANMLLAGIENGAVYFLLSFFLY